VKSVLASALTGESVADLFLYCAQELAERAHAVAQPEQTLVETEEGKCC
jgi:hypothetical protein